MSQSSQLDDSRLESLVAAADAFTEAVRRGERPSIADYARRHPQIAAVIKQIFPALQVLGPETDNGDPAHWSRERLGDFRLLSEIGRGGMGIVYDAEELSLRRRVALKVLPFAAMLDDRQLQRFKNEARAAATLNHPNIVPVYSVGVERGVHYYAMQRIDGQSVAEVIADLRQISEGTQGAVAIPLEERDASTPSVALTLAMQADHRIENPAIRPGDDLASDQELPATRWPADETRPLSQAAITTADTIHTPAFYRNVARIGHQAADAMDHAHSEGVLHRDIKPANLLVDVVGKVWITDFGLARLENDVGMTMTGDLLGTLRYMPPEQALGRRGIVDHRADVYSLGVTLYELLTQSPAFAAQDRGELLQAIESTEPTAPRKQHRSIPKELETIVLKAMAKEPNDRYSSARALADDLESFLDDRPIQARPAGWIDRTIKWSRRHKAIVASLAAVVWMALCGSLCLWWLASQAYHREVELRVQAETSLETARDAVDSMYTRVAEEWLAHQPEMTPLQQEFLELAANFYAQAAAQYQQDVSVRLEQAASLIRVGDIYERLGKLASSRVAYERAIAVLGEIEATVPERAAWRQVLLRGTLKLARVIDEVGTEPATVEDLFRKAVVLAEQLSDSHPGDADALYQLARACSGLGDFQRRQGKLAEAESLLRAAARRLESLANTSPDEAAYRESLATTRDWLGLLLAENPHRVDEAEAELRAAVALLDQLVRELPRVPIYQRSLSRRLNNLGFLLSRADRPIEAIVEMERSAQILAQLVADFPDLPGYKNALARRYSNLGWLLIETDELESGKASLQQAALTQWAAVEPVYRPHYVQTLLRYLLAVAFTSRPSDAVAGAQVASHFQQLDKLLAEQPSNAPAIDLIKALTAVSRGAALDMLGAAAGTDWEQASLSAYQQALSLVPAAGGETALAAAECQFEIGRLYWRMGEGKLAEQQLQEALTAFAAAAPSYPGAQARCRRLLGEVAAAAGDQVLAQQHWRAAMPLWKAWGALLREKNRDTRIAVTGFPWMTVGRLGLRNGVDAGPAQLLLLADTKIKLGEVEAASATLTEATVAIQNMDSVNWRLKLLQEQVTAALRQHAEARL